MFKFCDYHMSKLSYYFHNDGSADSKDVSSQNIPPMVSMIQDPADWWYQSKTDEENYRDDL